MRLRKRDLQEGQWWDEVGSAKVNQRSRKIVLLGTTRLMYETECGHRHSVNISSFLQWARHFAECKDILHSFDDPGCP